MSAFDGLTHFHPGEKIDGSRLSFPRPEKMERKLMVMLDKVRDLAQTPMVVTSSHRMGDTKSHGKGMAVDIRCSESIPRFRIIKAALEVGFTRIGVYNKHIHLDVDGSLPQYVMWWGESE